MSALPFDLDLHAADPVGWPPLAYAIVLAGLLGLRWALPRTATRARELCLLAGAGICYFGARSLLAPRDHAWGARPFLSLLAGAGLVSLLLPRQAMLAREFALLTAAWLTYFLVRGAEIGRYEVAIAHARRIIGLERRLGIFVEPRVQAWAHRIAGLPTVANWVYVWGHWPVIAGVLLWLALNRPAAYRRYRTAILLSGAAGVIVFALYPVAPPRLVPGIGLIDTIAAGSRSYRVLQPPALANPYAAMPSLHVGWDLLVGIALAREAHAWLARVAGALLPLAMATAVVATANHYLLDVLVGSGFALTALAVAPHLRLPALRGVRLSHLDQMAPHPS